MSRKTQILWDLLLSLSLARGDTHLGQFHSVKNPHLLPFSRSGKGRDGWREREANNGVEETSAQFPQNLLSWFNDSGLPEVYYGDIGFRIPDLEVILKQKTKKQDWSSTSRQAAHGPLSSLKENRGQQVTMALFPLARVQGI
jgi:hypothetical protein